jgi:hypothetical protein
MNSEVPLPLPSPAAEQGTPCVKDSDDEDFPDETFPEPLGVKFMVVNGDANAFQRKYPTDAQKKKLGLELIRGLVPEYRHQGFNVQLFEQPQWRVPLAELEYVLRKLQPTSKITVIDFAELERSVPFDAGCFFSNSQGTASSMDTGTTSSPQKQRAPQRLQAEESDSESDARADSSDSESECDDAPVGSLEGVSQLVQSSGSSNSSINNTSSRQNTPVHSPVKTPSVLRSEIRKPSSNATNDSRCSLKRAAEQAMESPPKRQQHSRLLRVNISEQLKQSTDE